MPMSEPRSPHASVLALRTVATVFGGSGFIGRYVVKRLARRGYVIRVAARDTEAAKDLMMAGRVGQVVPLYASLSEEATLVRALEGAAVAINLTGILDEGRSGDFRRTHVEGAGAIARIAAAAGVRGLVHVSAIGADASGPSEYFRSKSAGEAAVRAAFPAAAILRPSAVFGAEDRFLNRLGRLAMLSPVMPLIGEGTRLQPVFVGDVADAILAALAAPAAGTLFELGGPRIYTMRELLTYVLHETRRERPLWPLPRGVAGLQARLGELVPGKPFSRGQLAMLSRDAVADPSLPGLPALGVTPTPLELIAPTYLDRYRPGGGAKLPVPV